MAEYTVLVLGINSDGIRWCETAARQEAEKKRQGFLAFFAGRKPCVAPDFALDLSKIVAERRPNLLVVGTQDEPSKGSYLHSEFLPALFGGLGYFAVKREELTNVGASDTSLLTSLFARDDDFQQVRGETGFLQKLLSDSGVKCSDGRAAALLTHFWHVRYGRFLFVNVVLPDDEKETENIVPRGQGGGKKIDFYTYRRRTVVRNENCLRFLLSQIDKLDREKKPERVILFGDLNFGLASLGKSPADTVRDVLAARSLGELSALAARDELAGVKESVLPGFEEGVDGRGPDFLPTWRLSIGRADCRDESCFDTTALVSMPGWRDRILYRDTSLLPMSCDLYARFDYRNLSRSSHSGVIAGFLLAPERAPAVQARPRREGRRF